MSNEISHIQNQITHHRAQSTEHRAQSTEHRAQMAPTPTVHPSPAQSERINTWGWW